MAKVEPPKPYDLQAHEHLVPTHELSIEHKAALTNFRERFSDVTPAQQTWIDDACLLRYLRARDFKLDAAEKLLRGTLAWREDYGVEDITPEEIFEGKLPLCIALHWLVLPLPLASASAEARSGKNYLHGSDRLGRPVIYQRPRRQNTKTYDLQVGSMVRLGWQAATHSDAR